MYKIKNATIVVLLLFLGFLITYPLYTITFYLMLTYGVMAWLFISKQLTTCNIYEGLIIFLLAPILIPFFLYQKPLI